MILRRSLSQVSKSPLLRGSMLMRSDASEVEVGDYIEMVRGFDRDDVRSFGELIGDANPIHDEIVQGHLCSSLFSAMLGTKFHGCIYMSQDIKYRHVLRIDELVEARVTVRRVMSRGDKILLKCDTTCKLFEEKDVVVADGHAMVSV